VRNTILALSLWLPPGPLFSAVSEFRIEAPLVPAPSTLAPVFQPSARPLHFAAVALPAKPRARPVSAKASLKSLAQALRRENGPPGCSIY
jgi:hypothetical protein